MERQPAAVASLAVYSPEFGVTEETEEEKLLYFYPPDTPTDKKLRHVGLCEAMVNFTRTFSPDVPCEFVHTQQHRMVFLNPEREYWIVLQARLPVKTGGKNSTPEYGESDIQNPVLDAVLRQAYRMFKLFHGTFVDIVQRSNEHVLRDKLASFFSWYVPRIDLEEADLLAALDGIQFLPLDKSLYLRVQTAINYTEQMFPEISYTCFFYTHHLVWSGLEQDDIRVLYRYLNTSLYATGHRDDDAAGRRREFGQQDAFFVMGAENFNDTGAPVNPRRVFVGSDCSEHHLVIFQLGDVTMVFLLAATAAAQARVVDSAFYKALVNHLRPQLQELNTLIGRQQSRKMLPDSSYRYIYFNHMNLALKSTLAEARPTALTKEILKILADMHDDFERNPEALTEMCARTAQDVWVVGRRSDQREFYVIINKKDTSLVDMGAEVKKLCATQFANIFLD